jgi:hypothetical protein
MINNNSNSNMEHGDDVDSEDDYINYDDHLDWLMSESAKSEYQDLISVRERVFFVIV